MLHGRRVRGWVLGERIEPDPRVTLRPLDGVRGWGPPAEIIDLAAWAAARWAGRRASLLRTASPERAVRRLPAPARSSGPKPGRAGDPAFDLAGEALRSGAARCILRLPPAADLLGAVAAAAARGPVLVVTPSIALSEALAARARRSGLEVAVMPRDWAQAYAGAEVVIGPRTAAWAPVPDLAGVVVLDGHDESLQQEQAPTWNAWEVAAERGRRRAVPVLVASPCPTLELLAWGSLLAPARTVERAGWAALEVVDRRQDDPRTGLYSPRLVRLVREVDQVLCVLNRKGRSRLLACATCRELTRCERCGGPVTSNEAETLVCRRCGIDRPTLCQACGSTRLKTLRVGVSRVREELEALSGRAVVEVTAESDGLPAGQVVVGTEAVLHRVERAGAVAFLEFDQELLAPRYRAAEEALALLVRAGRIVGGRGAGRVLVQTRLPGHEVLQAALLADPGRLAAAEAKVRAALGLPPDRALALVSGEAASAFVAALDDGVEVMGPDAGRWLIRALDHEALARALAGAARPPGRLRIEVDPARA